MKRKFHFDQEKREGLWWILATGILSLLSLPYRLVCGIRLLLYQHGIWKQKKLPVRVISVGNITLGGTGKTPLVIYLAENLKEKNENVAILTRGYKRKKKEMVVLTQGTKDKTNWEDAGDEPYLLAQRLSGVPILVSKCRYRSGDYTVKKHDARFLILDDGFQHLKLFRDLDIVVIDSVNPFGNGRLLPAGFLREPLSSLKRADVFVLTKADQGSNKEGLIQRLNQYNPEAPIVESVYRIRSVEKLPDGSAISANELENKQALAFSGIGNPKSFESSLRQIKIRILKYRKYPDHFPYSPADIFTLMDEAESEGADFIITTEKDSVRIPFINQMKIPFYVLKIDLKIISGEKILWDKIEGKNR